MGIPGDQDASGSRSGSGGQSTSPTLLQRARDNDQAAWVGLIHLYAPLVRYWCGRWGVTAADMEDVAQEVFRAVAGSLVDFRRDRPGDTFRGWLRGITRHRVLFHFRRQAGHPRAAGGSEALASLQEVADHTPATVEEDSPTELSALYHRALALIRTDFEERTWEMFRRVVVEGRPPADVAIELGVTSAAVRKARSRVLHRLKEELGDLQVEQP
jgi:RNA polymerase sigma-70 factor (ECF subfamily)